MPSKTTTARFRRLATFGLLSLATLVPARRARAFALRDELDRQWTHEYLTYPLAASDLQKAKRGDALLGPGGVPASYQIVPGPDSKPRLAFQASLAPLASDDYEFDKSRKAEQPTDLKIEETDGAVRISNGLTGIALAKSPAAGDGPVSGVMLRSGAWAGDSRLTSAMPITGYSVRVTARGPVMAEAVCRVTFGAHGDWQTTYRVYNGEPVVQIDEKSNVDAAAAANFRMLLSPKFAPDQLLYRFGDSGPKGSYGTNDTLPLVTGPNYTLEAWNHWHAAFKRGNCFSVYSAASPDMLTVAACHAGDWVDPALPPGAQASPQVELMKDDSGVYFDLPVKQGGRKWMLGSFERDNVLAELNDPKNKVVSLEPYRYLIKYGHFPLDMIKDYVLRWPSTQQHPCVLVTRADVANFKAGVKDLAPYKKTVAYYLANPTAVNQFTASDVIPAWLATGDPAMGDLLAKKSVGMFQDLVNYLLDENGLPFGAAPHNTQSMATAPGFADIVYDSPQTTPEMRDRLRAMAAFLGYTTSRADYWSPERGYAANPNMTTSVYGYQTAMAAFLPDHPLAKQWSAKGLSELKSELDTWSDDNGGWLEAPSYAMLSYDTILAGLLMAHNAGFNDWLYTDPKVKKIIRWFSKTSTPPDSRIGGFRHHPPVGNTYLNEPTGEYGLLAYIYRDKDPQFSAEMQWQFQQNNKYIYGCIGGFLPAIAGFRNLLVDDNLPAAAPAYTSELFPQTGLVLRDSYPSARETYLHMIQGDNHAHYDDDEGSIIIYGKGRILSDEFGYTGYAPKEDHSLVETTVAAGPSPMHVHDFVTGPRFDYVTATKESWTRQIAMVKGKTSDSPAYYVMNDSFPIAAPATWRLWLTAQDVKLAPHSALVVGKEDVDMDVFFLGPDGVNLTTESKTRTCGSGMFPDWHPGPMTTTQIGLTSKMDHVRGFTAVLFPRLKTTAPATFTPLADGKGVKVHHEEGDDYVFLSNAPFHYDEGDIHFYGMAGMIQLRGDDVQLAMGSGGSIEARGRKTVNEKRLPTDTDNLAADNGDFENGGLGPIAAAPVGALQVSNFKGNPVPGDNTHAGTACAALALMAAPGGYVPPAANIPVDPTRTYRISMDVTTDAAIQFECGGYAGDGTGRNLNAPDGSVWEWNVVAHGPTKGWQKLETTIGPPGSGAKLSWPAGIHDTFLKFIAGGATGTVYIDNVSVVPQ